MKKLKILTSICACFLIVCSAFTFVGCDKEDTKTNYEKACDYLETAFKNAKENKYLKVESASTTTGDYSEIEQSVYYITYDGDTTKEQVNQGGSIKDYRELVKVNKSYIEKDYSLTSKIYYEDIMDSQSYANELSNLNLMDKYNFVKNIDPEVEIGIKSASVSAVSITEEDDEIKISFDYEIEYSISSANPQDSTSSVVKQKKSMIESSELEITIKNSYITSVTGESSIKTVFVDDTEENIYTNLQMNYFYVSSNLITFDTTGYTKES